MRRGTLLPLYPTLNGQLYAIAREHGLPSIGGLAIYLCEDGDGNLGPRIGETTWQALWSSFFSSDDSSDGPSTLGLTPPVPPRSPSFVRASFEHSRAASGRQSPALRTPSSFAHRFAEGRVGSPLPGPSELGTTSRPPSRLASVLPIVGRVEWTIEKHRAAWWSSWIGEAAEASSVRSVESSNKPHRTRSLKLSKGLAAERIKTPLRNISAPIAPSSQQHVQEQRPSETESDDEHNAVSDEKTQLDSRPASGLTSPQHATETNPPAPASNPFNWGPRPSTEMQWPPLPGASSSSRATDEEQTGYAPLTDREDEGEVSIASARVPDAPRRPGHKSRRSAASSSRHISKASRDLRRLTCQSDDNLSEQDSSHRQRTLDSFPENDESMWRALRNAPQPPPLTMLNGAPTIAAREDTNHFDVNTASLTTSHINGSVKDWIQRTQQSPDLLRDRAAFVPEDITQEQMSSEEDEGMPPPQDDIKDVMDLWISRSIEQSSADSLPVRDVVHPSTTLPVQSHTQASKLLSPIALGDSGTFAGTAPQLGSLTSTAEASSLEGNGTPSLTYEAYDEDAVRGNTLKPPRSPGANSTSSHRSNSASTDVSGLEDFERALELLSPVASAHGNSPSLAQFGIVTNGKKMTSRDSLNAARTLSGSVAVPSPRWLGRNRQSAHAGPPTPKQHSYTARPASASAIGASPAFSMADQTPRARAPTGYSGFETLVVSSPAIPAVSSPLRASFGDDHLPGGSALEPTARPHEHHQAHGVEDRASSVHAVHYKDDKMLDEEEAVSDTDAEDDQPNARLVPATRRSSAVETAHPELSKELPGKMTVSSSAMTLGAETSDGEEDPSSSGNTVIIYDSPTAASSIAAFHPSRRESLAASETEDATPDAQLRSDRPADDVGSTAELVVTLQELQSAQPVPLSDDPDLTVQQQEKSHGFALRQSTDDTRFWKHAVIAPAPEDQLHQFEAPESMAVNLGGTLSPPMASDFDDQRPSITRLIRGQSFSASSAAPSSLAVTPDRGDVTPGKGEEPFSSPAPDYEHDPLPSQAILAALNGNDAAEAHQQRRISPPANYDVLPGGPRDGLRALSAQMAPLSLDAPTTMTAPPHHMTMHPAAEAGEEVTDSDIWSQDGSGRYSRYFSDDRAGDVLSASNSAMSRLEESGPDTPSFYFEHQLTDSRPNSSAITKRSSNASSAATKAVGEHHINGLGLGFTNGHRRISAASKSPLSHPSELPLSEGDNEQDAMVPEADTTAIKQHVAERSSFSDEHRDVADDLDAMLSSIDAFNHNDLSRPWSRPSSNAQPSSTRSNYAALTGSSRSHTSPLPGAEEDDDVEHSLEQMHMNTMEAVRQALTNSERFAHEQLPSRASLTSTKSMSNLTQSNGGATGRRSASPRRASTGIGRSVSGDSFKPHPTGSSSSLMSPKPGRFKTLPPSPSVFPDFARDVQQPMSPLSTSFSVSSFAPAPTAVTAPATTAEVGGN